MQDKSMFDVFFFPNMYHALQIAVWLEVVWDQIRRKNNNHESSGLFTEN